METSGPPPLKAIAWLGEDGRVTTFTRLNYDFHQ